MRGYKIKIGEIDFNSKKSAIEFYREILNKYEEKTSVSDEDYSHLVNLLNYNSDASEGNNIENEGGELSIDIDDIIVGSHPAYKKTKCFYAIFGEEKWLFSYLLAINGGLSDERKFHTSCRNSIKDVLRNFKIVIFENKPVTCAVTKNLLTWENSQIDHKSPMTFSVIVKTFIKSKSIEVADIDLSYEGCIWHFSDKDFERDFVDYHNKVALLRVISSEENKKLSSRGRLKPTKNDYSVRDGLNNSFAKRSAA